MNARACPREFAYVLGCDNGEGFYEGYRTFE
jgi:hypothetical protein